MYFYTEYNGIIYSYRMEFACSQHECAAIPTVTLISTEPFTFRHYSYFFYRLIHEDVSPLIEKSSSFRPCGKPPHQAIFNQHVGEAYSCKHTSYLTSQGQPTRLERANQIKCVCAFTFIYVSMWPHLRRYCLVSAFEKVERREI